MGGIGKTVTGAAIVRDDQIRAHYDQVITREQLQLPVPTTLRMTLT